ncbi:MAG: hypothetical protein ACJ77A_04125 [Actinomycetota bacterium]
MHALDGISRAFEAVPTLSRRPLTRRVLGALVVPLVAATVIAVAPTVASAATCVALTGTQPTNPAGSSHDNVLGGVAVLSPCNAWAVGNFDNGTADQTLIEHWNGSTWTQKTSQNPGGSTQFHELSDADGTSASNVWAVGDYIPTLAQQTLTEHWTGSSWITQASPNPGGSSLDSILTGVAAISASNAWAVGYYSNGTADQTLVEHWNGTSWKVVPSPNPGGSSRNDFLYGVAAVSATNVWAVGRFDNGSANRTLIEHWNGHTWLRVASPNIGGSTAHNGLNAVTATSASDAWAVGGGGNADKTLIEHWNGKTWTRVTSPNGGGPSSPFSDLVGVVATSPSNAWATGFYSTDNVNQTLVEHWNGKVWTLVGSPNPGGSSNSNILDAVDASSASNMWTVGSFNNGTAEQTMAVHCC